MQTCLKCKPELGNVYVHYNVLPVPFHRSVHDILFEENNLMGY